MLRITVDLIPYGVEENKRSLGCLNIVNDGTGTQQKGNYSYRLYGPEIGGGIDLWSNGTIKRYQRNKGYWTLVKKILNKVKTDNEYDN